MNPLKRYHDLLNPLSQTNNWRKIHLYSAAAIGLAFAAGSITQAQVSTIKTVLVQSRLYNDVPGAVLTVVTNYPTLISFTEQNVSAASGFANRDVWHFSANGQTNAYNFQNNDYFTVSMNVTLTGNPPTPRKEAGFVFNNPLNDGGEFILDTDAHEIVAFGGFLPFYAFPATFQSGDTVRMGITVFQDSSGKNAIVYSANGVNSPALPFSNAEQGVINNTTIGGYFQIQQDGSNPSNSGSAVYGNISIGAPLNISVSGNQVSVYWPASATNYVLQTSTNLSSVNWTTVSNGLPIIGVTLPSSPVGAYFRLQAP